MDRVHTARRSASHGALRRRCGPQTSCDARSSPRPFACPPRGAKENRVLLASPGPLASMLKTSTETGDIGIFSIGPAYPSGLPPCRTAQHSGGSHFSRAMDTDGLDPTASHDHRQCLPSYRDTASEIMSMYGSDSQRSVSSSLSPALDDGGQRSYSMTSYGSRQAPNPKSGGPWIGPTSTSLLQRPRSPFPYPARLKRPGMRPASPALTKSGGVDYTRMVEIDRASHAVPTDVFPQWSSAASRNIQHGRPLLPSGGVW